MTGEVFTCAQQQPIPVSAKGKHLVVDIHCHLGIPAADAIVQAATTDADRHQPEYAYYPTQWVEPYLDRRRRCGFGLYATLGIARDDAAALDGDRARAGPCAGWLGPGPVPRYWMVTSRSRSR